MEIAAMSVDFNIPAFDALMSLMGLLGVWQSYKRIHHIAEPNPVERRLKLILVSMLGLLFFRFPDQYLSNAPTFFPILTYVSAMALSFANFLFFETLMRKHMPLWVKIYMTATTGYFLIVALMGQLHGNIHMIRPFIIYILLSILILALVVLFRRRQEHTKVENQLLDLSLLSLVILGPFFLTDIVTLKLDFPNLGALGGLIFSYMCLYNQSLFLQNRKIFFRFLRSIYLALFMTFMISQLMNQLPTVILGRIFVMCLSAILVVRIYYAVKHLDADKELFGFVDSVIKSDKTNSSSFLNSMSDFFSKVEKKVIREKHLEGYDKTLWASVFDVEGGSTLSLFQINEKLEDHREALRDGRSGVKSQETLPAEKKKVFEQVKDLLEKYEMTHILKLNSKEHIYVCFQVPIVGYERLALLNTDLVRMTGELISKARA